MSESLNSPRTARRKGGLGRGNKLSPEQHAQTLSASFAPSLVEQIEAYALGRYISRSAAMAELIEMGLEIKSAAEAKTPLTKHLLNMSTTPSKELETFENPQPGRDYTIRIDVPEFTCLCPKTGQPDFATLLIEYVPETLCVELKSLKLYVWSFRDEGAFHEAVTNRILDDLVAATRPRFMRLTARFNVRGGIYTTVVAEHRDPEWVAPAGVSLP